MYLFCDIIRTKQKTYYSWPYSKRSTMEGSCLIESYIITKWKEQLKWLLRYFWTNNIAYVIATSRMCYPFILHNLPPAGNDIRNSGHGIKPYHHHQHLDVSNDAILRNLGTAKKAASYKRNDDCFLRTHRKNCFISVQQKEANGMFTRCFVLNRVLS